jgi:diacylglycerol kinase (ATP)
VYLLHLHLPVAENKFSSIGPIYYEYGSMVITYEDSAKAVRALYTLRESSYEDKHLLGESPLV